jgi:hypothetical protein
VVLVRAYTEARLSFEKGRLIALSGLAKRIREKARPNRRLGHVSRTSHVGNRGCESPSPKSASTDMAMGFHRHSRGKGDLFKFCLLIPAEGQIGGYGGGQARMILPRINTTRNVSSSGLKIEGLIRRIGSGTRMPDYC